jgi:hypothetical protein
MTINLSKRVGPYVGVSRDEHRPDKRFRLVLYGAYDALGLIGSECNGILVLDEREMRVTCDEIACIGTGWMGPSPKQQSELDRLLAMSDSEFAEFINGHPRRRYEI